jgi:hypothetical protein
MSKNRGKSKLSKNVLFNANKHVFNCEKSLATLFYGQLSYLQKMKFRVVVWVGMEIGIGDVTGTVPTERVLHEDGKIPVLRGTG